MSNIATYINYKYSNSIMKAIIFDLDGTLLNSEKVHRKAEIFISHIYNICPDYRIWNKVTGKKTIDVFKYVIKKYKLRNVTPEEMVCIKLKYYLKIAPKEVKLYPHTLQKLGELKKKYRLALTTSSQFKEFRFILPKIRKYFEVIINGDMVKHGKPNPEPYLMTIKKLKLKPKDCVVVEDADNGIISAKRAGVYKTIGLTQTLPKSKMKNADYVCKNIVDVVKLIERID